MAKRGRGLILLRAWRMSSVQSAKVLTRNDRVLDVFTVVDSETKAAILDEQWVEVKAKVLAKLKRRRSVHAASADPLLMDQVRQHSHISFLPILHNSRELIFLLCEVFIARNWMYMPNWTCGALPCLNFYGSVFD